VQDIGVKFFDDELMLPTTECVWRELSAPVDTVVLPPTLQGLSTSSPLAVAHGFFADVLSSSQSLLDKDGLGVAQSLLEKEQRFDSWQNRFSRDPLLPYVPSILPEQGEPPSLDGGHMCVRPEGYQHCAACGFVGL